MQAIYLDNNSTTEMLPEVADTMAEAYRAAYANPSSVHRPGQQARRLVEDARERIVRMLGGDPTGMTPDRFVFTSGGTESNNLALRGICGDVSNANLVASTIEHQSVTETARDLQDAGVETRWLPVDSSGIVCVDPLHELLDDATRVVSVMLGNHETGVIQPIGEVARIARSQNVPTHCDAVQAVGKIPVSFRTLEVDMMSVSAHKIHGPVGIGGLLIRHDMELRPIATGGFQQQGIRPGTESVAMVLGFAKALEAACAEVTETFRNVEALRDRMEQKLRAAIPAMVINGADADRLPHTSNLAFPGINRQEMFLALDMAGVACSTGSACASGSSEPSPVLTAMGLDEPVITGSIRISLSRLTTIADIDLASDRILRVYNGLRRD